MSQEDFRKIIDNARQILVGKLPNPQDQIDAITYALMYKFMSDIDDQSASLPGGKRTYFAGDYEKYNWHNLMRADGQDQLILYREAIERMSKNSSLPALFREIFNGAMLKFNDPRTLRLFLKEMDAFVHGNSDSLGDAYEYLLSLMGSQGGLGQFRTPRHIIKFIVDVVDPDKTDKILDPAAGTAGFLIEAYSHILRKHDGIGKNDEPNNEKRLTSAELDKIHENFRGFDIDATMIRTSRVNMYLHGFKTPDIIEHDSLTSEDYWSDKYDVILANPPFMTPKGGIQPHKKFGVQANRAEVLFVDYIASHLKPNGKAGVIVPEGVIFQSGTAYKQLRKNLVDNSLIAVISLPSGVFQPYAGVKTSILVLDSQIAKERNGILFVKVENDGFGLTTQRRSIELNDLPQALEAIKQFKQSGTLSDSSSRVAHIVSKSDITKNADYNLTSDRYIKSEIISSQYPQITMGELEDNGKIEFLRGQGISKNDITEHGKLKAIRYGELYTLYQTPVIHNAKSRTNFDGKIKSKIGDIYVPATTTADAMGIAIARSIHENNVVIGGDINIIRPNQEYINSDYLSWLINGPLKAQLATYAKGANILHLSNNDLRRITIILPPLDIQNNIVTKIATKQQAIDHAYGVIETLERERRYFDPRSYITQIDRLPVRLSDVASFISEQWSVNEPFNKYIGLENIEGQTGRLLSIQAEKPKSNKQKFKNGDILFGRLRPNLNKGWIATFDGICSTDFVILRPKNNLLPDYLLTFLQSSLVNQKIIANVSGSRLPRVSTSYLKEIEIPLPPIEIQKDVVAGLNSEQEIINSNKLLINIMLKKITQVLETVTSA